MISNDSFTSYAQYHEDIVLAALLSDVKKGFYVDVGANHEEYHSVTKYFYKKGWSGINIDPIPRLIQGFKKRKRDVNLQVAVSDKKGTVVFREYPEHDGLSTLSKKSREEASKVDLPHTDYEVAVDTLSSILSSNNVTNIDFLKIDVEGHEAAVLRGNDWKKFHPKVICIEANHKESDWSRQLKNEGYVSIINDGLNEYYVEKKSVDKMLSNFGEKAALLSHNSVRNHHVKAWMMDIERIAFLEDFTNKQDALIKTLTKQVEALSGMSLADKSYKSRVKIAAKGLTTDYYKKNTKSDS